MENIEQFCSEMVKEYLPDYRFAINKNLFNVHGRCHYGKRLIELSGEMVSKGSQKDILEVLIHEIAHGLNPRDGHGRSWKNTCKAMGGDPSRCKDYEGVEYTSQAKYILKCSGGHINQARKRKTDMSYKHCRKCGGYWQALLRRGLTTLQESNKIRLWNTK